MLKAGSAKTVCLEQKHSHVDGLHSQREVEGQLRSTATTQCLRGYKSDDTHMMRGGKVWSDIPLVLGP
jgi:hypothetical protein